MTMKINKERLYTQEDIDNALQLGKTSEREVIAENIRLLNVNDFDVNARTVIVAERVKAAAERVARRGSDGFGVR